MNLQTIDLDRRTYLATSILVSATTVDETVPALLATWVLANDHVEFENLLIDALDITNVQAQQVCELVANGDPVAASNYIVAQGN